MNTKERRIIAGLVMSLIITTTFSLFLWTREGYTARVLQKLGFVERTADIDLTALGWEKCMESFNVDVDVVMYGDSLTHHHQFLENIDLYICNMGVSGDWLTKMYERDYL